MNIPKKIAYITVSDPKDKHAWSGTNHYIWKTLERHFEQVDLLGPDEPTIITFLCKVIHGISLYLFKKRFDYRHSTIYAKACGRLFGKKLKGKNYDLIVSPGGIAYIAYLETTIPIVFIGDRIIANAIGYHAIITNLWKWSEKQSLKTEKKALHKASLNILASHWAADYAISYYHLDSNTTIVLPFGANLDSIPSADYVLKDKMKNAVCKLLLIGTSWKNKGVDIAINALTILLQKGFKAELTIVGCTPSEPINHKHITIIPFINKNTAQGLKHMEELYLASDFFILPTRFEAYGLVFCEASAYGLISLASNTGGVPVKEGVNGYLIDHSDQGEHYAEKIEQLWNDQTRYLELKRSTRILYDEQLNWESWMLAFKNKLNSIDLFGK